MEEIEIVDKKKLGSTVKEGLGSMLQANVILMCAWLISTLIGMNIKFIPINLPNLA